MSGPSDKAVEAANRAFGPSPLDPPDDMREILDAAHDPALGLDRSVCLRDVVEWFRAEAMPPDATEPPSAYLLATVEAFECEFGE